VDNALTYRCAEGTPQVRITSKRIGGHVVIQVADNGIGIEPEYHEKIFQVFQRLHSRDEYPGTGLGLAIVDKAVRVMEGDVSVESALGRGSTFTVRLPAAPGGPAQRGSYWTRNPERRPAAKLQIKTGNARPPGIDRRFYAS